jgi:exodeoxyribonuclease VII large subunit
MIIPTEKTIFSVSQLNRKAKQLLETHLPLIWVSGELSNLARPASGHWYFSLKDERAQVSCAMFKPANQRVRWQPMAGEQVLVRARVSLYEGRGDYQLIIEHMEAAGSGALQQAYEALKQKLLAEGLLDDARKQKLPLFPQHIGVITSPTGAAIRDILSVLQRRYPIAPVSIISVAVQGDGAAAEMIAAIDKAIAFQQFDVLIIARGGGSIEDLWAFNNEALARAIAACPIPIISAVGHEVDFTICDFVADVRAPTPSVSAEIATPDLTEWQQLLDQRHAQLLKREQLLLSQKQVQLRHLQKRLRHPGERINVQLQKIEHYQKALVSALNYRLSHWQQQLQQHEHRYQQQHPERLIAMFQDKLVSLTKRSRQAIQQQLNNKQQHLAAQAQLLNAVSPLGVLSRGYSITSNHEGALIRSAQALKPGDTIHTQLGNGGFASQVLAINTENK